jgi:hypothetical protein
MTDEPAPRQSFNLLGIIALLVATAALGISIYPPLQTMLPWYAASVDIKPLEKNIAIINARLDAVNEKLVQVENTPAPVAELPADINNRLTALEEKTQKATSSVNEQNEKLQQTAHLPVALALVRVEERFERGQDFTAAWVLVQKLLPAPFDESQGNILAAAAQGVPTTAALLQTLDASERAVRRAERLTNADNPIDRIWAELQSLILIKRVNDDTRDATGRALAALRSAVLTDDATALQTAWQQLPPPGQSVLQPWKADVDKRLAARAVLNSLIDATLIHE